MLYSLSTDADGKFQIEPQAFESAHLEQDLEGILADRLFDMLFEDSPLLPIYRERPRRAVADLYALNSDGDLVIFELKRGTAGEDAVQQILRYAQAAGHWTFDQVCKKYSSFRKTNGLQSMALDDAHREAFQLERALEPKEFNRLQHLYIIGSAADDRTIKAVAYWQRLGLRIQFAPYRIYSINGSKFLEFFSPPYDRHRNPAEIKGVMFDTNRTWNENSIWDMMEQRRVAAYGSQSKFARRLKDKDLVFFFHPGYGLVAAGRVSGPTKGDEGGEEYHDVQFLTNIPNKEVGIQKWMPTGKVTELLGKNFYWASTAKVPYLSREEAELLLDELKKCLV